MFLAYHCEMTDPFSPEALAALGLGPLIQPHELPPHALISHISGLAFPALLKDSPNDPDTKALAALMKRATETRLDEDMAQRLCAAIDGYLKPTPSARPKLSVVSDQSGQREGRE